MADLAIRGRVTMRCHCDNALSLPKVFPMPVPNPIAVNDVIRVTFFQTMFEQRILTVLHARVTVAPATGTSYFQAMDAMAIRVGAPGSAPIASWKTLVTSSLLFDSVRCQRVFPTKDVYFGANILELGTNAGTSTMANNAMSIEKKTLRFGESGVGRIQMAGVPNDQIEDGIFKGAYIGQAEAAWDDILGDQTVTGIAMTFRYCLFHGGAPEESDDLFDVIPQATVRTMHRRTVRVGE